MTESPSAMQIDAALVRQLADLLDESRLTEIEVQDGERRIKVVRKAPQIMAPMAAATAPAQIATAAAEPSIVAAQDGDPVPSPMVGTVFLAAEPDAKPFVAVGDKVVEGQTLLIIEAMKVMNPIVATRGGVIAKICVENGQPVEYDQPLVFIA